MKPTSKEVYARLLVLYGVVAHAYSIPWRAVLNETSADWSKQEREVFDSECRERARTFEKTLRDMKLWGYASPQERKFFRSYGFNMDEYAQMAAGWRIECAGMMMWSLRLIKEWPPMDTEMSTDLLHLVKVRGENLWPELSLREEEEIQAKRDLIEFWHWRVREQRLLESNEPLEVIEAMKKAGMYSRADMIRVCVNNAYSNGKLDSIMDDDFVFLGKPFHKLDQDEYEQANSIIMERHYALNWICGMAPRNRWDATPTDT